MSKHDEDEVWAFVQEMNRAWTVEGKPERLVDYFAPEMIAITPTDCLRREGREACVAGWTEFVRATKIIRWIEKNPLVLMLGKVRRRGAQSCGAFQAICSRSCALSSRTAAGV